MFHMHAPINHVENCSYSLYMLMIDGLVQDCSLNAQELLQSYTKQPR